MSLCFRRPGRIGGLVAASLLFLAACDSAATEDEEACPPEPSSQEAAYFPRTVGTTWRFDYRHALGNDGAPTSRATTGTLTWTLNAVECEPAVTRLRLVERFEGVEREVWYHGGVRSEQPRTWTRPLVVRLEGAQLVIPGYTNRVPELSWIHPRSMPDTLRVRLLHAAGFGVVDETAVELVRDVGLVGWYDGKSGRQTNLRSLQLLAD